MLSKLSTFQIRFCGCKGVSGQGLSTSCKLRVFLRPRSYSSRVLGAGRFQGEFSTTTRHGQWCF